MALIDYQQIARVTSYTDLSSIVGVVGQLAIDITNMVTYQYNGTSWLPLGRPNVKLSSVAINAMSTGTYLIYTLEPSPVNFVPTQIVVTDVSQTGSVVTAPVITVGTNSTNYDNIAKGSLVGSLLGSLGVGNSTVASASGSPKLAGGTAIYAKVTTAAIGPTAMILNVDVLGYLKT